MNSKLFLGLSLILTSFTTTLILIFFKDGLDRNIYRIIFTAFYDIALMTTILFLFLVKRKINFIKKLLYLFVNLLIIFIGCAFLYLPTIITGFKEIITLIPIFKELKILSSLLSTVLVIDLILFVVINFIFFIVTHGFDARKSILFLLPFYIVSLFVLFFINSKQTGNLLTFYLTDLILSGSLFIVFYLLIFSVFVENKRLKYVSYGILYLFIVLEIVLIFLSKSIINILPASVMFYNLYLIVLAINFISMMICYTLLKKGVFKNSIIITLLVLFIITFAIFFLNFSKDIKLLLMYFIPVVFFESLTVIDYSVILDTRQIKLTKRILLSLIPALISTTAFIFIFYSDYFFRIKFLSFPFIIILSIISAVNIIYSFFTLFLIRIKIRTLVEKKSKSQTKAIKPPFEAYKGQSRSIFVSYSHKDMGKVFNIINMLFKSGYRIWYDEGIEPGNEWPEVIGRAIERASQLLVFLSSNAVSSRNVRNEINYGFSKNKEIIVIMLENTKLTQGLELQIGTVQAIKKFQMNDSDFFKKLNAILKK